MKLHLTLILLLFNIFCFAQSRSDLDSLNELSKTYVCVDNKKFDSLFQKIEQEAVQNNYHTQLADALIIKAYSEQCTGNYALAIRILRESINHFKIEDNSDGLSRGYNQIASAKMRISEMDSAFYYSNISHEFALILNDTILLANSYLVKSGLHTAISNNDSIIYYALKGLEILGSKKNDKLRGGLNIAIGGTYYQNEEFAKAITYYKNARKYFSEESMNMGRIYHNVASAYTQIDEFDSSFHYFFKTIPINEKLNRKLFLAYNYHALAHNYAQVGNCDKSIEYNLLSMAKSDEVGEIRSKSAVLANISECYLKVGKIDQAISSVEEALLLTKKSGDVDKEADAYFLLSEAYKARGRYKEAFEAHKSFYSLDSMLLGRDRQTTIAGMEAKYDSERKEAEIASLSQQASIQALEIQQKNQAIVIGVVVFLFVLAAIFFVYKQRETKKKQSQTELEQRFLRSQLNPHFISNALVAVQSFMLKNDSESAALYLTKFSKLMREILENSRKEFIPVEEEISMLKNFLDIHKLRLGSFEYSVELDKNIDPETDTIPPMFVQPFLENAVEHGIGDLKEGGKIDLKFKKEGNYIAIAVNDNGKGLKNTRNENHTSLSTSIIKERMTIFNQSLKQKIQLVVDNLRGENGEVNGTQVELKVPFRYV